MRKLLALALVLITVSFGVPTGISAQAQAPAQLAAVSGQATDSDDRPLVGQRVELVQGDQIVASTTTGSRGEWSFTNVRPGDYVVRVMVNGQVAGIRVSVTAGQTVANALIVAPSAAAPSASFLGLGTVGGPLVGVAIVAAIVTTVVIVTGS